MTPRSEFAQTARTVYLGMVGPLLLTLPTTVLVARGLGPADKGLWSIMLQVFFVSEMVASMGAAAYYIVRLGRDLPVEDAIATSAFQGLSMSSVLGIGAVALGLPGLLSDHVSTGLGWVLAATLVLLVVGRHLAHLGIGAGRPGIYSQATLTQAAVQLGAVGAFAVTRDGLTLAEVVLAFALGALARVVVPAVQLLRVVKPKWRVDFSLWSNALQFGWRRALSEIEDSLNTRVPLLLVSAFDPLAAVGVYSISLGLAEIMGQTGSALALAALRGFAGDASSRVAEFSRLTIALSLLLAVCALPASLVIPFVFGDSYSDAQAQLLLLLPTVPVLAVNRMLISALSASDRVGTVARSGAASLAGITLLGLALTPPFGANGASVALLLGMLIQTVATAQRLSRDGGFGLRELLVPRRDDFRMVTRQVLGAVKPVRTG